jgi:hypothetical protein
MGEHETRVFHYPALIKVFVSAVSSAWLTRVLAPKRPLPTLVSFSVSSEGACADIHASSSASLYQQGVVSSGQFAFKLTSSGAELSLGTLDTNAYTGSVTYTPVTQQGYWQVAMGSANVAGSAKVSNRQAIIDTGKCNGFLDM